ncbi:MAG: hypothetical protein WC001_13600 [Desulfurivibrionaceae bacterium]
MAIQAVAAVIPWKKVIEYAPEVLGAAKKLWEYWRNVDPKPEVDPQSEIVTQISAVVERLQRLESSEIEQSNIVKQIAEQLQGASVGLIDTSRKALIGLYLGIGAFILSAIALGIVASR